MSQCLWCGEDYQWDSHVGGVCSQECLTTALEHYAEYVRECVHVGFSNLPFATWLYDR